MTSTAVSTNIVGVPYSMAKMVPTERVVNYREVHGLVASTSNDLS